MQIECLSLNRPGVAIKLTSVPTFVLDALRTWRGNYTSRIKQVFHCVWLEGPDSDPKRFQCVGVAGDGDNGCYEIFKWKGGKLECSDCAYGSTSTALLHGLVQEASL